MPTKAVSETNTENLFRSYYGPQTFIEKSAIPKQYGFKSKNGTTYKGYPDFYKDSTDYSIIVEAKAKKHIDAVTEVQFYMLENNLRATKDLIGIAVSGQTTDTVKVSYFYLLKGTDEIKQFAGKTLLPISSLEEKYLNAKNGDVVSDEELTTILTGLNKQFHDHKVSDTDRSLFFSGIMIALTNSNFRNTYSAIQAPTPQEMSSVSVVLLEAHYLNSAIISAVESELNGKINNLSKEFSWKDRFAFIKTIDIPLVSY